MNNRLSVALLMLLVTGCGAEIAYKRGATAQDLQASKAACQKATSEQELNQCLEDNGWAIQKLDGSTFSDDELFATASVSDDNRTTTTEVEKPAVITTTGSLKEEPIPKAIKQTEDAPPRPSNQKNLPSTPVAAKPQASIFDTYVIKSWWKMGGTATLLEQNMQACSDQLGEAHYPNKKTFTFTRGFAVCMRQKGWRGLIEK